MFRLGHCLTHVICGRKFLNPLLLPRVPVVTICLMTLSRWYTGVKELRPNHNKGPLLGDTENRGSDQRIKMGNSVAKKKTYF